MVITPKHDFHWNGINVIPMDSEVEEISFFVADM